MTREDKYKAQLRELGIYETAFDPLIKELAQAERQRTRAQKEWAASAEDGGKPSFLSDLWPVICDLDKKILSYREAMGLTPKSLRRLRGVAAAPGGESAPESISAKLDRMLAMEDAETSWSFEELAAAVPIVGTGKPAGGANPSPTENPSAVSTVGTENGDG